MRGRGPAILLLLLPGLSAGCDKLKARQQIQKGNEFFKAQQYQPALASYQEALRLDPGERKLHKNIGFAYMGLYQPGSKHPKDLEFASKAIEHLKKYTEAYPEDKRPQEFLISLYLSTDRFDEAAIFYQEVLKESPRDSKAMHSLAQIYFKKGDYDTGVGWLKKRLEVEDLANQAEIYYLWGVVAWDRSYHFPDLDPVTRAQTVEDGLAALQKALEFKPDYFEAVSYVNLLYREKAKIETDPVKQQEYMDMADRYRDRALELQKKSMAAKPTPEPAS